MNNRQKLWGILIGFLFVSVIGALIAAPRFVKSKIVGEINDECPRCRFSIDDLSFEYFSRTAVIRGLSYRADPADTTIVNFTIDRASVALHLHDLLGKKFRFRKIKIEGLDIQVADDDLKPPAKPSYHAPSYNWVTSLPEFSVEGVTVLDSKFTYLLKTADGLGKINVDVAHCQVGAFGTRATLSEPRVEYELKGRLEREGHVEISGTEDLFEKINHDKVMIDIQNINLERVSHFFDIAAGLKIAGVADHIRTDLEISEGHLEGKLRVKYHDLSVSLIKTKNQDAFKVLVGNLFAKLVIAKTKPQGDQPAPIENVNAVRAPGQGVIKFIITGLKDAVMKIIKSDPAKN